MSDVARCRMEFEAGDDGATKRIVSAHYRQSCPVYDPGMNATAIIQQLDERKLRERLDEIESESQAIRVLLRSARAKARARARAEHLRPAGEKGGAR